MANYFNLTQVHVLVYCSFIQLLLATGVGAFHPISQTAKLLHFLSKLLKYSLPKLPKHSPLTVQFSTFILAHTYLFLTSGCYQFNVSVVCYFELYQVLRRNYSIFHRIRSFLEKKCLHVVRDFISQPLFIRPSVYTGEGCPIIF